MDEDRRPLRGRGVDQSLLVAFHGAGRVALASEERSDSSMGTGAEVPDPRLAIGSLEPRREGTDDALIGLDRRGRPAGLLVQQPQMVTRLHQSLSVNEDRRLLSDLPPCVFQSGFKHAKRCIRPMKPTAGDSLPDRRLDRFAPEISLVAKLVQSGPGLVLEATGRREALLEAPLVGLCVGEGRQPEDELLREILALRRIALDGRVGKPHHRPEPVAPLRGAPCLLRHRRGVAEGDELGHLAADMVGVALARQPHVVERHGDDSQGFFAAPLPVDREGEIDSGFVDGDPLLRRERPGPAITDLQRFEEDGLRRSDAIGVDEDRLLLLEDLETLLGNLVSRGSRRLQCPTGLERGMERLQRIVDPLGTVEDFRQAPQPFDTKQQIHGRMSSRRRILQQTAHPAEIREVSAVERRATGDHSFERIARQPLERGPRSRLGGLRGNSGLLQTSPVRPQAGDTRSQKQPTEQRRDGGHRATTRPPYHPLRPGHPSGQERPPVEKTGEVVGEGSGGGVASRRQAFEALFQDRAEIDRNPLRPPRRPIHVARHDAGKRLGHRLGFVRCAP